MAKYIQYYRYTIHKITDVSNSEQVSVMRNGSEMDVKKCFFHVPGIKGEEMEKTVFDLQQSNRLQIQNVCAQGLQTRILFVHDHACCVNLVFDERNKAFTSLPFSTC